MGIYSGTFLLSKLPARLQNKSEFTHFLAANHTTKATSKDTSQLKQPPAPTTTPLEKLQTPNNQVKFTLGGLNY